MATTTRLLRVLVPVCAALSLGSCGQAAHGHSEAGGRRTTTGATSAAAAVFPVTLVRLGGIAGYQDRMQVDADGTVTFSRHGGAPQRCRARPPLVRRIGHAAGDVQWPDRSLPATTRPSTTVPPTKSGYADELVVLVRSPQGAAPLGAAAVLELQDPLTRLLADVSSPASQQRLCRPLR